MKKIIFSSLFVLTALLFVGCGPSALDIKEMSSDCEFNVEVRYVPNDSIGLFVGNTLFLSTQQLTGTEMFPMLISTRNPMNIDIPTATDAVRTPDEFTAYLVKRVPSPTHFGIIVSDNVGNEIGFDESKAVKMLQTYFQNAYPGSSAVLFHEKGGDLVSAKTLLIKRFRCSE